MIKFKAYGWLFVVECYNFCNFFLNFTRSLDNQNLFFSHFHSILLANNFKYHETSINKVLLTKINSRVQEDIMDPSFSLSGSFSGFHLLHLCLSSSIKGLRANRFDNFSADVAISEAPLTRGYGILLLPPTIKVNYII